MTALVDTDTQVPRPPRVLVLGGFGFIGRHAVQALRGVGCTVLIGSRDPQRHRAEAAGMTCRQVRFEQHLRADDWRDVIADVDAVLNCVGILRPRRRETYERVHHLAPAALAEACCERRCRLIHVSALGLDGPVRSGFLLSKRAGEAAIRSSGADWLLVRPSLLDADRGGFGARWLRRVARWPVHALPADARGRIAALRVEELGEALAKLVTLPLPADASVEQREFELGGLAAQPLVELLAALRRAHTSVPAWHLPVPPLLARLASHVCDLLHFSPYSFGHLELLRQDNCPRHNRLPELLGRAPHAVGHSEATGALRPVALPIAAGTSAQPAISAP